MILSDPEHSRLPLGRTDMSLYRRALLQGGAALGVANLLPHKAAIAAERENRVASLSVLDRLKAGPDPQPRTLEKSYFYDLNF